jgi:hypothetical protein
MTVLRVYLTIDPTLLSGFHWNFRPIWASEPVHTTVRSHASLFHSSAHYQLFQSNGQTKHSVALVRERTIPTERQPLLGEVSANFCRQRVSRGQRDGSPQPYSHLSRPKPLLFLPTSSSNVHTSLGEPRSRPTTFQKIW